MCTPGRPLENPAQICCSHQEQSAANHRTAPAKQRHSEGPGCNSVLMGALAEGDSKQKLVGVISARENRRNVDSWVHGVGCLDICLKAACFKHRNKGGRLVCRSMLDLMSQSPISST